jgi:hypothetical protein
LRVARGYGVPPITLTPPDRPTALMGTESNAQMNEGDNDV